jgi:hypothetical protein
VNGVDMPRRGGEAINIEWVEWADGLQGGTHRDATVNKAASIHIILSKNVDCPIPFSLNAASNSRMA